MKIQTIVAVLSGAAILHAVLAACSSSGNSQGAANAQSNASAPAAVEVAVEPCDKSYDYTEPSPPLPIGDGGSQTYKRRYAEHAYPGHDKFDLAGRVTNWNPPDPTTAKLRAPGTELSQQLVVYVRDGFAGAPCMDGQDSTTFIYTP